METFNILINRTFASLRLRDFRLYYIGLCISQIGDWMQIVAVGWLVLQVTGSGVALGTVIALRFAPILIGGPFAGIIVDSLDKKKILYFTQGGFGLIALCMSVVVFLDATQLWMIYLFALGVGTLDVLDKPTRQTFVHLMVGPENIRNAVSLNSTGINIARSLGPLVAGVLIAGVGMAFCFFAKALSSIAILWMLTKLRISEVRKKDHQPTFDLLSGVRYAMSVPIIRTVLFSMAIIGTLSYEFAVTLPLLAERTYGGTAADFAALLSAMGAGSVAGGLFAASRKDVAVHEFIGAAFFFGISMCVVAFLPTLTLTIVGMIFIGFFSITLTSAGNTMIQLESVAHLRGRVMALWTMAIFGSTLIGAPIIGAVSEFAGARWGLAVGGLAAIVTALVGAMQIMRQDKMQRIPEEVVIASEDAVAAETTKL